MTRCSAKHYKIDITVIFKNLINQKSNTAFFFLLHERDSKLKSFDFNQVNLSSQAHLHTPLTGKRNEQSNYCIAPIGFFQNQSLFPKLLTQELNCRSLKIINVVHQEPSTNYIPRLFLFLQCHLNMFCTGGKKGKINCETQFKEFKLYSSQQNTLILLLLFFFSPYYYIKFT